LTNLAQPSISHHLRKLVDSGMIDQEKNGREIYLVLNQPKMETFLAAMDTIKLLMDSPPVSMNER
jgi:ArsR family transcriptional regulator, arsenate/arsenite/antimonite-responsive transcriptional repressor